MAPRRPPPSDELVEKILLRLPTNDPASLLRAALACKRWARLVSSPGFRARFRDFHSAVAVPMLGFLCDHRGEDDDGPKLSLHRYGLYDGLVLFAPSMPCCQFS